MIRFRNTPSYIQKWYSSMTWKRASNNAIYLTFDDGPHPDVTPWVDEQLNIVNAKATFFCIGENLDKYSEVAKNLVMHGHRLGNHTFNHLKGWNTSDVDYLNDVKKSEESIEKIDYRSEKLFRPPYGRIKKSQIQLLKGQYEIVMWTHLSWDFDSNSNFNKTIQKLKKAKPGSIIVFHDSMKAFAHLQKMLPELLSFYSKKGFKFEIL